MCFLRAIYGAAVEKVGVDAAPPLLLDLPLSSAFILPLSIAPCLSRTLCLLRSLARSPAPTS